MHLARHTVLSIPVSLLIFSAVYTTHAMPIDSEAGVGSFSTLGTTVVLGTRDAVVHTGLHAWIPNPLLVKDTVNVFCIDHRPSDDKTRKRETKPLEEDPKLQQSIRELVVAGKGAMGLRGRGDPEVKYTWKSCPYVSDTVPVKFTLEVQGSSKCADRRTSFCTGTAYWYGGEGERVIQAEDNTVLYRM